MAINTLLRLVQPHSIKWVIRTKAIPDLTGGYPLVIGYDFGPVRRQDPEP